MRNTILTVLTFMTSLSFASPGFGPGNGGDGIVIRDEVVMRDFVSKASYDMVADNAQFLSQVPDLKKLLADISKGNRHLAIMLLWDLLKSNIYLSNDELRILPAGQTSPGGTVADVQLAVRYQSNIILGPQFGTLKDRAYLLVHEALHGLIKDAEGPMHHVRVRSFVKYLKDNRGKFDQDALAAVMKKVGVESNIVYNYGDFVIDPTIDRRLRCASVSSLDYDAKDMSLDQLPRFLGIRCDDFNGADSRYNRFVDAYLADKFTVPGWEAAREDKYRHAYKIVLEIPIYDFRIVYGDLRRFTEVSTYACANVRHVLKYVKENKDRPKIFAEMSKGIANLLLESKNEEEVSALIGLTYGGVNQNLSGAIADLDKARKMYQEMAMYADKADAGYQQFSNKCRAAGL